MLPPPAPTRQQCPLRLFCIVAGEKLEKLNLDLQGTRRPLVSGTASDLKHLFRALDWDGRMGLLDSKGQVIMNPKKGSKPTPIELLRWNLVNDQGKTLRGVEEERMAGRLRGQTVLTQT